MGGKDGCKGRLEAVTISDILYLFGQGNFIFIREKSGNFEKWCLWQPSLKSQFVAVSPSLMYTGDANNLQGFKCLVSFTL